MSRKTPLYPHVTKSRKQLGTEELKSWGELTPQEKLAYARRVVGSGIPGWDNMKAIAYEMGIEPDEDEIPTLFELKNMPGIVRIDYDAILSKLDYFIKDEQKAAKEYRDFAEKMHAMSVMEGYSEIQSIARDEDGHKAKLEDLRKRIQRMKETS